MDQVSGAFYSFLKLNSKSRRSEIAEGPSCGPEGAVMTEFVVIQN